MSIGNISWYECSLITTSNSFSLFLESVSIMEGEATPTRSVPLPVEEKEEETEEAREEEEGGHHDKSQAGCT